MVTNQFEAILAILCIIIGIAILVDALIHIDVTEKDCHKTHKDGQGCNTCPFPCGYNESSSNEE